MTGTEMTMGIRAARWAWVVAAAATIALVIRRLDDLWSEARSIGARPDYFNAERQYALSTSQAEALSDIGLSPDWHAALVVIRFILVAITSIGIATLLWRRARTWAPLFLSFFLLSTMMLTAFTDDGSGGELPGWLGIPVLILFAGGLISMFGLLMVFPDDRSARWFIPLILAAATVPMYASITDNNALGDWIWENGMYVAGAVALGGLVLQTVRIVRSRDRTARDLLVLTIVGVGLLFVLMFGADSWSGIEGSRTGLASLVQRLGYETLVMAVPLVYGLAVLWILVRRGHWDMDVQMKGSVGYAGLTTLLVLGYFGLVAVVQAVVNDVSGVEGSTFALMVSTALIAAAFLPARAALQNIVDRVFDRRHRHAERLIESFESQAVRDTRPDQVAAALLGTVEEVFRPAHAELWTIPDVTAEARS
jgi:hypothetical protein